MRSEVQSQPRVSALLRADDEEGRERSLARTHASSPCGLPRNVGASYSGESLGRPPARGATVPVYSVMTDAGGAFTVRVYQPIEISE